MHREYLFESRVRDELWKLPEVNVRILDKDMKIGETAFLSVYTSSNDFDILEYRKPESAIHDKGDRIWCFVPMRFRVLGNALHQQNDIRSVQFFQGYEGVLSKNTVVSKLDGSLVDRLYEDLAAGLMKRHGVLSEPAAYEAVTSKITEREAIIDNRGPAKEHLEVISSQIKDYLKIANEVNTSIEEMEMLELERAILRVLYGRKPLMG